MLSALAEPVRQDGERRREKAQKLPREVKAVTFDKWRRRDAQRVVQQ